MSLESNAVAAAQLAGASFVAARKHCCSASETYFLFAIVDSMKLAATSLAAAHQHQELLAAAAELGLPPSAEALCARREEPDFARCRHHERSGAGRRA